MDNLANSSSKDIYTKYLLLLSLIVICLFLAFYNHPPILSLFESPEIYNNFLPTKKPTLMFAVSEDPVTNVSFGTFDYATILISRYLSDYLGHSISNIRLPSLIYGLLALFLLFIITNRWFGWKIALISTLLLSTNQHFLIFQHSLIAHMATLTTILFCIERFQSLTNKKNNFTIISFGFACALTCLHYWYGRWGMLCILFFYLFDFNNFSISNFKSYLNFTNKERIKTFFLILVSTIIILTIFYPANIFVIFSSDFIYPTNRIGNFSSEISGTFQNIWINFYLFFKNLIFDKSKFPSDIMLWANYPVENILVFLLSIIGIIISLSRKVTYPILFTLYVLFITFFPQLFSETYINNSGKLSSTLNPGRSLFFIPFACIMAAIGLKFIYTFFKEKKYFVKISFVFFISLFFCFRFYGYFAEINRFNDKINSYNIDFSRPAPTDNFSSIGHDAGFNLPERDMHYDQIYYYQLSKFILKQLKEENSETAKFKKIIYVPSETYTPSKYKIFVSKGSPYYLPMYLTFYLQEQGLNVSYLGKIKDIQEPFLKKAIKVLDRYKQGKNQSPGDTMSDGHYPRNKKQEESVKMFINIIEWIESYEMGKKWLDSIRTNENYNYNNQLIDDYFVSVTSKKTPDYLLITNKKQLESIKNQNNYIVELSMPIENQ